MQFEFIDVEIRMIGECISLFKTAYIGDSAFVIPLENTKKFGTALLLQEKSNQTLH